MCESPIKSAAFLESAFHFPEMNQIFDYEDMTAFDINAEAIPNAMMFPMIQEDFNSNSAMSNPWLQMNSQNPLAFQDSTGQLWRANNVMPPLNPSNEQMADQQLMQSPPMTATSSPIPTDDYNMRQQPVTSNQDMTEWQEKVRTERRKVQNRAAQRAYRERKEKALSEMRELLDQKEIEFNALRKDHQELKEQYEELLSAQRRESSSSGSPECKSNDDMPPEQRSPKCEKGRSPKNRR